MLGSALTPADLKRIEMSSFEIDISNSKYAVGHLSFDSAEPEFVNGTEFYIEATSGQIQYDATDYNVNKFEYNDNAVLGPSPPVGGNNVGKIELSNNVITPYFESSGNTYIDINGLSWCLTIISHQQHIIINYYHYHKI